MPAISAFTVADAQATPVNHVFDPIQQDANGVWWFEDSTTIGGMGTNRVSLSVTRPTPPTNGTSSKDRVVRVKLALYMPTLETLSNSTVSGILPAPVVAYVERCNIEYIVPERSTELERKNLAKFMQFLISDTKVTDSIRTFQALY